jgi:biopolymer transport protein ExbD
MISTPMMHNAIRVNVPKGTVKDSEVQKEFAIVSIDHEEKFFVGRDMIARDELFAYIQDLVTEQEQIIYVKADQSVSYGIVLELVDQMRMIPRVTSVVLLTQAQNAS